MSGDNVKYHQNVLAGFDNGCLLDLRVRLAIDFLKAQLGAGVPPTPADEVVDHVLDLADELLKQAEERGWVEELPDDAQLNSQVKKQMRRIGAAQVYQQQGAQAVAREEADLIQRAVPHLVKPQ